LIKDGSDFKFDILYLNFLKFALKFGQSDLN